MARMAVPPTNGAEARSGDGRFVERLRALADPSRLRIVEFLLEPNGRRLARRDGVCACDFEALLDLSQPTVSHHLKNLVNAGLLRAQKRGRWTFYEIEPQAFRSLARHLGRFALAAPQEE